MRSVFGQGLPSPQAGALLMKRPTWHCGIRRAVMTLPVRLL
ncbi:hypothetical protein [Streptomyces sp. NPDC059593]